MDQNSFDSIIKDTGPPWPGHWSSLKIHKSTGDSFEVKRYEVIRMEESSRFKHNIEVRVERPPQPPFCWWLKSLTVHIFICISQLGAIRLFKTSYMINEVVQSKTEVKGWWHPDAGSQSEMLIFPNLIFLVAQLYLAEAASEEVAPATYHPHFFLLLVTLTYIDKHLCKPNSFVFVLF